MSPILVRPVREQLEHDRVIRLLQAKYKRKFEVAINPGNEQSVPVGTGPSAWYPDLVLQSGERTRKLVGVVEVETSESVNNLEAMSQWAAFSRLRVPFHLYIPVASIDTARRLCADLQIPTTELWAYHSVGEQMRFTLVQKAAQPDGRGRATAETSAVKTREAAAPRPSPPARSTPPARAAAGRTRPATARPSRRVAAPAAPSRRAVGKQKAATPRRAAKAAARKPATGPARAQKRR